MIIASRTYARIIAALLAVILFVSCGVRDDGISSTQPINPSIETLPSTVVVPSPDVASEAQPFSNGMPPSSQEKPVACTFPIPGIARSRRENQTPDISNYTFSNTGSVLTGQVLSIAGWLPDNKRFLLTRLDSDLQANVIEALDIQTGIQTRFAATKGIQSRPVWLQQEGGVAFVTLAPESGATIHIARPNEQTFERVVSDVASPYIAATPQGDKLVFFERTSPSQPKVTSTERVRNAPVNITASIIDETITPTPLNTVMMDIKAFKSAWAPVGTFAVFYNNEGVYLVNSANSQICTINLGYDQNTQAKRWAYNAQWSPDGQQIAFVVTIGDRGQMPYRQLFVLNLLDGSLQSLDLGIQYIYEVRWLPNASQIVVLGKDESIQDFAAAKLYVADIQSKEFRQVLSEYSFTPGGYSLDGGGLSISPDGKFILTLCPDWDAMVNNDPSTIMGRICLIRVE